MQALEKSYVEAPAVAAAYVQPVVQPAYLSHQYIRHQPTVFAAEYSTLPVSGVYATDHESYHLPTTYSAPAAVATHSNYAPAPAPVAVAGYSTHSNYAAPPAPAAAPVAAAVATPVATASQGDYQSVSSASTNRNTTACASTRHTIPRYHTQQKLNCMICNQYQLLVPQLVVAEPLPVPPPAP